MLLEKIRQSWFYLRKNIRIVVGENISNFSEFIPNTIGIKVICNQILACLIRKSFNSLRKLLSPFVKS